MSIFTTPNIVPSMTPHADSMLPVDNPTLSVWQTSHDTPVAHFQSTPELPQKSTIVIVGSGISAVFAARQLLSTCPEADVLVLEARGTCSGATGRNGGHLLPNTHGEEQEILEFELRNFHHVADLIEREAIPCDFRRLNGVIGFWNSTYFKEAKEELEQLRRSCPKLASLVTIVEDPQNLQRLRLREAVGAIIQGTAASLSPYKLVTWLWQNMLRKHRNLNLQTDTAVTSLRLATETNSGKAGWTVHTPRGTLSTDYVILTTNGYTAHLLPQFRNLITPLQLTMSAIKPPPSSPLTSGLLTHSYGMLGVGPMDRVQGDHLVQQPLESGGQMMFGGARAVVEGNGVGIWDDSYVDETARRYLRTQLAVLLDLESEEDEAASKDELVSDGEWAGIPGYSRDHLPWVGGVPGMDGVFLCAGYSGHGMPNAPLSSRHIASLVSAAIKGRRWQEVEQLALEKKAIPSPYAITVERLNRARSSPKFP